MSVQGAVLQKNALGMVGKIHKDKLLLNYYTSLVRVLTELDDFKFPLISLLLWLAGAMKWYVTEEGLLP